MIQRFLSATLSIFLAFGSVPFADATVDLTAPDIQPISLVSGEVTTHTVSFTTPVEWPANGSLEIGYSFYFGVSSVTDVQSASDVSGGLSVSSQGQTITVTRQGNGSAVMAGSTIDDLRLVGIKNAVVVGWGGTYNLTMKDGQGQMIASGVAGQDQFTTSQATMSAPDTVEVLTPNGGENLRAGESTTVRWNTTGMGAASVRVWASYDAGNTWAMLVSSVPVSESYAWIPTQAATRAKVKVQTMLDSITVLREDISDADFSIAAAYGLGELGNTHPLGELGNTFATGTLFRTATSSSLYEVLADGKRYVYPSERVYFTHHANFDLVTVRPWSEISQAAFGGRMRAAVGSLVKMPSVPVVYRVDAGYVLRPIASESVAIRLYGSAWAKRVMDISEVEYVDYSIGTMIE